MHPLRAKESMTVQCQYVRHQMGMYHDEVEGQYVIT